MDVVATATDGLALLPLVRQHLPDIVFMDLSMPDFDPVAAVKIIRREQPAVRCVALTADNNPYYIHAMVDAGAWGY
ncbi:MAG: response regulator, partial [Chloroflexota bacterium]